MTERDRDTQTERERQRQRERRVGQWADLRQTDRGEGWVSG